MLETLAQVAVPEFLLTPLMTLSCGGVGWLLALQFKTCERLARIEQQLSDLASSCPTCKPPPPPHR